MDASHLGRDGRVETPTQRLNMTSFTPGAYRSDLTRLTEETQLQKMLADEKMRSEQHRLNYQTLKAEHSRLQDENIAVQRDLQKLLEDSQETKNQYKSMLEQARKEIIQKNTALQELESQVLTPQRMDVIRLQMTQELEHPIKEKLVAAQQEVEQYRTQYNHIKFDHTFLKTEYEHLDQQHKTVVDSLRQQHEVEVTNLRKEREVYLSRQQSDSNNDAQKVRVLQRENSQLNQKIKGLLGELEEIRQQRENLGLQSDHVTRLQAKQLTEHSANIRALETEKQSYKTQCENLQRELIATNDLHTQLTAKIHSLESTNDQLRNNLDELTHTKKVEVSNLKMEIVKQRGDLERQRDQLASQIDGIRNELEISKHCADQQAGLLVEKERECVKHVQAAREEEWDKINKLETERLELETKIQEYERRRLDDETRVQALREKTEDEIKDAMLMKETAEKECAFLRTKLKKQKELQSDLDETQTINSRLKEKVYALETEINTLLNSEHELQDLNNKLSENLEYVKRQYKHAKEELGNVEERTRVVVAQTKAVASDDKDQLMSRISELEQKLQDVHNKHSQEDVDFRKKKKQYLKMTNKLKDRVKLLESKCGSILTDNEVLRKSKAIPQDEYDKLKKSYHDLRKRQIDYKTLLQASVPTKVPIGNKTYASFMLSTNAVSPLIDLVEPQEGHQGDIRRRSLDMDLESQAHTNGFFGGNDILTSTLRQPEAHEDRNTGDD